MAEDEIMDKVMEESEKSNLNNTVAILVSITATIMALGKVKSDNIVQQIHQHESEIVDTWAFYQAKSTKQDMFQIWKEQLGTVKDDESLSSATRARFRGSFDDYTRRSERYEKEKGELKSKAEGLQKEHDSLLSRQDQFDASEGGFSLSLSLFALTVLTRRRWLLWVGIVFALFGLLFSVAAFAGWSSVHFAFIDNLLG